MNSHTFTIASNSSIQEQLKYIARRLPPLTRFMHIGIETEKRDKLTNFFVCFFSVSKKFQFGVQFQLDSKTILNSASKMKTKHNRLNVGRIALERIVGALMHCSRTGGGA